MRAILVSAISLKVFNLSIPHCIKIKKLDLPELFSFVVESNECRTSKYTKVRYVLNT